jgi:hypothetical protein
MADLYQERLARLKTLCGEKPPMMLTLRVAALVLGVKRSTLAERVRRGYFENAAKNGNMWMLPTNEVLNHQAVMRTPTAWMRLQEVLEDGNMIVTISKPGVKYRTCITGAGDLYVGGVGATPLMALTEALEGWPTK